MINTSIEQSTRRRALVLSGGSIRGAFQAGAIHAVLQNGYKPDIIQGLSAGALNGAYLANEAGRITSADRWEQAGKNLRALWLNHIKRPKDLVIQRGLLEILFQIATQNFKGIFKPKPLKRLLKAHIDSGNVKNCPADFLVGAVNLLSGAIEYKTQVDDNIIDFILASSSMPILFPHVSMNSKLYYDGGIRDNAPLRHVIKEGATEIILILTQTNPMEKLEIGKSLKPKKITHLIDRSIDILLNDVLVDDLKELKKVNFDLNYLQPCLSDNPNSSLNKKRTIKFKVIRPEKSYQARINKFDRRDIHQMLMDGYSLGTQAMHRPFETGIRLPA